MRMEGNFDEKDVEFILTMLKESEKHGFSIDKVDKINYNNSLEIRIKKISAITTLEVIE